MRRANTCCGKKCHNNQGPPQQIHFAVSKVRLRSDSMPQIGAQEDDARHIFVNSAGRYLNCMSSEAEWTIFFSFNFRTYEYYFNHPRIELREVTS